MVCLDIAGLSSFKSFCQSQFVIVNNKGNEDNKDNGDNGDNKDNGDKDDIYSASTVSFCDINQVDLVRQDKDKDDDSSISTVDFDGVDFGLIIEDIRFRLIR